MVLLGKPEAGESQSDSIHAFPSNKMVIIHRASKSSPEGGLFGWPRLGRTRDRR